MARIMRSMLINLGIVGEFFVHLWRHKMWWMIPLVIVLLAFAILVVFGSSTGLAPFIYTVF
jgi:hypothetical protein